jgi:hypothetical protein
MSLIEEGKKNGRASQLIFGSNGTVTFLDFSPSRPLSSEAACSL